MGASDQRWFVRKSQPGGDVRFRRVLGRSAKQANVAIQQSPPPTKVHLTPFLDALASLKTMFKIK